MEKNRPIFFDHRHHLLRVRGCTAELDILPPPSAARARLYR